MNKFLYIVLLSVILIGTASNAVAFDFGPVSVNDTINFPLVCLDTLGRAAAPDSVHVLTWYHGQGANAVTFSKRSASPKSTPYIDTTSLAGSEYYYFIDPVDNLDSSAGEGVYSGQVILWIQNEPTFNPFSFTKISDEAKDIFARLDTNISSRSDYDVINDRVILANNAINDSTLADNAFTGNKIAPSAWLDMREYVWANIDTLSFPTDSSDFMQYLIRTLTDGVWDDDTTGHYASGKYGYEVLQALKILPDSIFSKIDSLLFSAGYDSVSLQQKLGAFGSSQSSSTTLTLRQWLANSVGIDGVNNLHTKIDNLSLTGGGTEPETLIIANSVDSTLIQGASITLRTIDQSTVKINGLSSDINGKLILDLDADSFFAAVFANNYNPALDTLIVEQGGGTDTIWLASFNPGNPPSPDLCRVFGWVYDITGQPLSDIAVTAEIPTEYHPVKYSNVIITPFKKTVQTNSIGYWEIDLFPNSLLSDPLSRYYFTIEYPSGIVYKIKIEVPDLNSWQLQ